jgi:hypothetical protein
MLRIYLEWKSIQLYAQLYVQLYEARKQTVPQSFAPENR